ncbi:hypothetical protein GY45DRAFT_27285 [Cubamyces sp. BRFM 1775]|nr:hypothetical protein GY45DRAFT_27285 [Cubamyces sp. BRFM 1775]
MISGGGTKGSRLPSSYVRHDHTLRTLWTIFLGSSVQLRRCHHLERSIPLPLTTATSPAIQHHPCTLRPAAGSTYPFPTIPSHPRILILSLAWWRPIPPGAFRPTISSRTRPGASLRQVPSTKKASCGSPRVRWAGDWIKRAFGFPTLVMCSLLVGNTGGPLVIRMSSSYRTKLMKEAAPHIRSYQPPMCGLDLWARSAGAVALLCRSLLTGRIGFSRHDANHSNDFLVIPLCLGCCLASRERPNVVPAPPAVRIARTWQSRPCSSFAHSNPA